LIHSCDDKTQSSASVLIPQQLSELADIEDDTEESFVPERKDMTTPLIPE
jgi:hypothetical protein